MIEAIFFLSIETSVPLEGTACLRLLVIVFWSCADMCFTSTIVTGSQNSGMKIVVCGTNH